MLGNFVGVLCVGVMQKTLLLNYCNLVSSPQCGVDFMSIVKVHLEFIVLHQQILKMSLLYFVTSLYHV